MRPIPFLFIFLLCFIFPANGMDSERSKVMGTLEDFLKSASLTIFDEDISYPYTSIGMKSLLHENQLYIVTYQMLPNEEAARIAFEELVINFSRRPGVAQFSIGTQTRILQAKATRVVLTQGRRSIVNVSGTDELKGSENVSLETIKSLVKHTMDTLDQGIDPFKN